MFAEDDLDSLSFDTPKFSPWFALEGSRQQTGKSREEEGIRVHFRVRVCSRH
jgi:hypothetical protein